MLVDQCEVQVPLPRTQDPTMYVERPLSLQNGELLPDEEAVRKSTKVLKDLVQHSAPIDTDEAPPEGAPSPAALHGPAPSSVATTPPVATPATLPVPTVTPHSTGFPVRDEAGGF